MIYVLPLVLAAYVWAIYADYRDDLEIEKRRQERDPEETA